MNYVRCMQVALIAVGSAAALPAMAQEPLGDLDPEPLLNMDHLIMQLPPAGTEWMWDREKREGREHPKGILMGQRLERGVQLSDQQWRDVLLRTGAVGIRTRWPVEEPFAVSMTVPRWFNGPVQIQLKPRLEGLRQASAGELYWGISGTWAMIRARDAKYQRLGSLPPDVDELVFDVTIERGEVWSAPFDQKKYPEPGMVWAGELAVKMTPVKTIDEAIPPVSDPELDAAVRDAIGAGFRTWGPERRWTAFVVVDPDLSAHPRLRETGLSLKIEVLRDGEPVESGIVLASRADELAMGNSVQENWLRLYGSRNLQGVPGEMHETPDGPGVDRFALRITGVSDYVLTLWDAKTRWSGQLTIPLREALEREQRRVGPAGRGPEISTPYAR